MTPSELNTASYKLMDILLKAFEESSTLIPAHPLHKDDWYTEGLRKMRRTVNRLHRHFGKGNPAADKAYNEFRRKFERERTKAKKLGFRKFTEKLDNVKDIARLQKCYENGPRIQITSLEKKDGTYTRNINETLVTLMETHFPDCEPVAPQDLDFIPPPERIRTDAEIIDILETVTPEKVIEVLDSFSPFKAPGEDNIFPALFQRAKDRVAPILSNLFGSSLILGLFQFLGEAP